MADYDWNEIDRRRDAGEAWPSIAEDYGVTPGTIRKANSRRKGTAKDSPERAFSSNADPQESVFFVRVVKIR